MTPRPRYAAAADWSELQDFEKQFDDALPVVLAPFAAAPFDFQLCGEASIADIIDRTRAGDG